MDKVQAYKLLDIQDTQGEIDISMAFLRLFPAQHPLNEFEYGDGV